MESNNKNDLETIYVCNNAIINFSRGGIDMGITGNEPVKIFCKSKPALQKISPGAYQSTGRSTKEKHFLDNLPGKHIEKLRAYDNKVPHHPDGECIVVSHIYPNERNFVSIFTPLDEHQMKEYGF